jgi:hypothetical protein
MAPWLHLLSTAAASPSFYIDSAVADTISHGSGLLTCIYLLNLYNNLIISDLLSLVLVERLPFKDVRVQ